MKQNNNNDQIQIIINLIDQLIEKYVITYRRRSDIVKFFDKYGERFFTAPASSNTNYHECFPGGLAIHTARVINYLLRLYKSAYSQVNLESMITVGLFHDCGKIGSSTENLYLPQTNEWKRNNGNLYELNQKLVGIHHSRWSIFLLQDVGFKLNEEEFESIMFHDGQYLDENKSLTLKERNLTLLLHQADRQAMQYSTIHNKK